MTKPFGRIPGPCAQRLIASGSSCSGLVESSRLQSGRGPNEQQLTCDRADSLDLGRGAAPSRLLDSGSPPAGAVYRSRPLALRTVNAPVRRIETPLSKGASLRSVLREQFQMHQRHASDGWSKNDPAELDEIDKSFMLNKFCDHCGVNHRSIAIALNEILPSIRR